MHAKKRATLNMHDMSNVTKWEPQPAANDREDKSEIENRKNWLEALASLYLTPFLFPPLVRSAITKVVDTIANITGI